MRRGGSDLPARKGPRSRTIMSAIVFAVNNPEGFNDELRLGG